MKLTTTQAAVITTGSLTQTTLDASSIGDVTFTISLVHDVPANGMIVIVYPSEVGISSSTITAELVSPSAISPLSLSLVSSQRRIQITDMFPSGATAGTSYQFILKNVQNSNQAASTGSFEITTFVSSTGDYRIDAVKTGLALTAN